MKFSGDEMEFYLRALSPPIVHRTRLSALRLLIVLFKLRIVALLLVAAAAGAFLGGGGRPGAAPLTLLVVTGGMAAAGASALNEYLERARDARMRRTRHRPLVTGAIARPGWVPAVGAGLIVGPVLAVLPLNPALAFFLGLGGAIYVGVYTLWLKPRTPLNIVVGGGAGSCAVLSGGAAVGAWADPGVLVLAVLVFLWTPTHFWSLAMIHRDDYARAGIPMLPVRVTPHQSARWILVHAAATCTAALALAAHPLLGPAYMPFAGLASAHLLVRSSGLLSRPDTERARAVFKASNAYLAVILLAVVLGSAVHPG